MWIGGVFQIGYGQKTPGGDSWKKMCRDIVAV
jgi:hypothetical protein